MMNPCTCGDKMEVIIFSRKVEDKLQDHEGRDLYLFANSFFLSFSFQFKMLTHCLCETVQLIVDYT
jgi:hypothetical protein